MNNSKNNKEKIPVYNAKTGEVEQVEKIIKTDEEWKKILSPTQFEITRKKGTEKPYTGQCALPLKKESGKTICYTETLKR